MNDLTNNKRDEEIRLKDIFKLFSNYKWLIIFIMTSALLVSSIYLYYTPSTYSTNAIIEVKTRDKSSSRINDDILQNTFYATNTEINKEIEVLKTFGTNKKVIDSMNFKSKVFSLGEYKKTEIYGNSIPIEISNIDIINEKIIDRLIRLIPEENGYRLQIESTSIEKILNLLTNKEPMSFNTNKIYKYNETINTDYFKLLIKNRQKLNKPLCFKIYSTSRSIYDNIIKDKLVVEQLNGNAPLIRISYQDNIPQRATIYVNSLVDVFLQEGRSNKNERNDKIQNFLNEQLNSVKSQLNDSEKRLEKYKIKNKVIKTSTQADTIIRESSEIEVKISENLFKRKLIDNLLTIISSGKNFNTIGSILTEIDDRASLNLINLLQELELEEEQLRSEYTSEYPKLVTVRNNISVIKDKIYQNIKNSKSFIKNKISNLRRLKQRYENDLLQLPTKEIKLVDLARKHEVNSKMYAYLLEKKSENDMIKVATTSDYKIIEKAYSPTKPVAPKRFLIMLLALILGFIAGTIIAMIHNRLNDKIKDQKDIENSTDLDLYGVIPFIKQKGSNIEVFNRPQSAFAESFRQLRTDLQFISQENKSSTILITSMVEKEGKSNTVANLSSIFQLAGFKSIVIDLDLRNPTLHKYFDIEYDGGMSRYLSGKDTIADIVFSTTYPNLDIIPAGPIASNPSELLLSNRLNLLLEKLKKEYDYIFIDSAPLGEVSDTLNIMKLVDINLFILRKDYAKKPFLNRLEKMISKYNLKNIKLVMNASNKHKKNSTNYIK